MEIDAVLTEQEERLELYKVVVSAVASNEQRRQQLSTVYLSLIAAGGAAYGAIENVDVVYFAVPALVMSILWYAKISYFLRLSKAKFVVIDELESGFSYKPFKREWDELKLNHEANLRVKLTDLERGIPLLVALSSLFYLIFRICTGLAEQP